MYLQTINFFIAMKEYCPPYKTSGRHGIPKFCVFHFPLSVGIGSGHLPLPRNPNYTLKKIATYSPHRLAAILVVVTNDSRPIKCHKQLRDIWVMKLIYLQRRFQLWEYPPFTRRVLYRK